MVILDDIQWADTPFPLGSNLVLAGWRGSMAHGTYIAPTEPTSIDDRDIIGIVVPPLSWYVGMRHWHEAQAIKGEWDTIVYELGFFVSLLCKQNPNVLSLLWLRPEDYIFLSPVGKALVAQRALFRARDQAYVTFMGYANGQLKRMGRIAGQGYLGAKRRKLVEQFGYDVENAAHLVRLLHMGIEYLETGTLTVYREIDRDMLLAIKRGEWTYDRVCAYAEQCFARCKEVKDRSPLPPFIDMRAVNDLVVGWVRQHLDL